MLRRVCVAAALISSLVAIPTAMATMPRPRHASRMPAFRVAGTKGYTIDVWAKAHGEHERPEVFVSIWKRHVDTVYANVGQVGPGGFSASFRRFGWVDVRYRPGPPRTVKDCGGRERPSTGGQFTGTFEFHGDWRFTVADYPHLVRRPLSEYAESCWSVGRGRGRGVKLEALSWAGTTEATQNRPGGKVRFVAHDEEEYGSMKIYRYLETFAPGKDFAWSHRLRSARVTPPAPFHGTATFSASRRHSDWRGNLTVDFPGFRGFPLTWSPTLTFLDPGSCVIRTAPHRPQPPISCP